MQLNAQDMAIIQQALREAINQGADYYKIATYQSVLGKIQESAQGSSLVANPAMNISSNGNGLPYDDNDSVEIV